MSYFSRVSYTGNAVITDFVLPFPYLEKDDISVTVNNADTPFTWVNTSTVKIDPAPANGTAILIKRTTDVDAPKVDYADGSTLTELDLDTSHKQEVYKLQELVDHLADIDAALTSIQVVAGNLPVVTGADNGKILVVIGGAWTPVLPVPITVQTDSQIDGVTYKFQKKTRTNVKVVAADAESAWTDEHTGTPCP
jgi:hypothetical protein